MNVKEIAKLKRNGIDKIPESTEEYLELLKLNGYPLVLLHEHDEYVNKNELNEILNSLQEILNIIKDEKLKTKKEFLNIPVTKNKEKKLEHEYVYFIKCNDLIKIGYTKRYPHERFKDFETSNPFDIKLVYIEHGNLKTEKKYHNMFKEYSVTKEWFCFKGKLKSFIENKQRNIKKLSD